MKIRKVKFYLYLPLLVLTTALFHFSVYADSQISFYRDNYTVRSFGKSLTHTKDRSNCSLDFGSLLVEWFSSNDALASGSATSDSIDIRLCFKRLRQSNNKTPVTNIRLVRGKLPFNNGANSAGSLSYESSNGHSATVILSVNSPSGSAQLSYDPLQLEPDPQCPVFIHNKQSQQGEVPSRVTVSTSSTTWDQHLSPNTLIPYEQNTGSRYSGEIYAGGGAAGPDDQNDDDFFKRPGGGSIRLVSFEWSMNPYQWYLVLAGLPVETSEPAIRLIVWHDDWRNTEIPIDINLWQELRLSGHHRDPQVLSALSRNPSNPAEAYRHYLAQHPELTYQQPDTPLVLNLKELNRLELIPGRAPLPVSQPIGKNSGNTSEGASSYIDYGQRTHAPSPTHSRSYKDHGNNRQEDDRGNGSPGSNLCDCGQPRFRGSLYCKRCISTHAQARLQQPVKPTASIAERSLPVPEPVQGDARQAALSAWFHGLSSEYFDTFVGAGARFNLQQVTYFIFSDSGIHPETPHAVQAFLTLFAQYEATLMSNKKFIEELINSMIHFSPGNEAGIAEQDKFKYQLLHDFLVQIARYHEHYFTNAHVENLREKLVNVYSTQDKLDNAALIAINNLEELERLFMGEFIARLQPMLATETIPVSPDMLNRLNEFNIKIFDQFGIHLLNDALPNFTPPYQGATKVELNNLSPEMQRYFISTLIIADQSGYLEKEKFTKDQLNTLRTFVSKMKRHIDDIFANMSELKAKTAYELMALTGINLCKTRVKSVASFVEQRRLATDIINWNPRLMQKVAALVAPKWKELGRSLGVGITNIELDYSGKVTEQTYQMLLKWYRINGFRKPISVLTEALDEIGMSDAADKLVTLIDEEWQNKKLSEYLTPKEVAQLARIVASKWKSLGKLLDFKDWELSNIEVDHINYPSPLLKADRIIIKAQHQLKTFGELYQAFIKLNFSDCAENIKKKATGAIEEIFGQGKRKR